VTGGPPGADRLLVFSRTTGYRHASIPAGIGAFRELAAAHGLAVEATEDPAALAEGGLERYAAVVFLSATGEVLDDPGRAALQRYVCAGGGFLGVHSAANAEPGWPFYGRLLGARFAGHPEPQAAVVTVEDRDHPATAHLPARWRWDDEWYDFTADPRPAVRVLASVDERQYRGPAAGADRPLVWCQPVGAGRSFYTALGHAAGAYRAPEFQRHLLGALSWTARLPRLVRPARPGPAGG
jgi:uncharacterized protein